MTVSKRDTVYMTVSTIKLRGSARAYSCPTHRAIEPWDGDESRRAFLGHSGGGPVRSDERHASVQSLPGPRPLPRPLRALKSLADHVSADRGVSRVGHKSPCRYRDTDDCAQGPEPIFCPEIAAANEPQDS